MQITGSASNMPYIVPAETDTQNSVQTRQQTLQQTQAALQVSSSDKVYLSAEAKALSNQQTQANTVTAASQNTGQVNPGLKAQDTTRTEQSASAPLQAAQSTATAQTAPAEPTEMAAARPETARETAPARVFASPENASVPSQPTPAPANSTSQNSSPVAQTVAPQNQNTPQKPAQEAPMAAAGGMSTGKYSINLSV